MPTLSGEAMIHIESPKGTLCGAIRTPANPYTAQVYLTDSVTGANSDTQPVFDRMAAQSNCVDCLTAYRRGRLPGGPVP